MGNVESVDGQSEMKHHIMPLKVPMPDPTELEEKFAIVLFGSVCFTAVPSFLHLCVSTLCYPHQVWVTSPKSEKAIRCLLWRKGGACFLTLRSVAFSSVRLYPGVG
ncbi:hypothetical protein ILYODFUR_019565 [Ilyodon furcidens]|uniref:Uncharacterized protein n=1 Tax=Ilyodon furcidens TaxID=33524 RepID=A0ABV0TK57_9TELE